MGVDFVSMKLKQPAALPSIFWIQQFTAFQQFAVLNAFIAIRLGFKGVFLYLKKRIIW
jgi:hypothetical protein